MNTSFNTSGTITVGAARLEDEQAMRNILRKGAMTGAIHMAMARDPDIQWAMEVEGDRHHAMVARVGSKTIGLCTRSARRVWLNGQVHRVGYLGAWRLLEGQKLGFKMLRNGFDCCEGTRQHDEATFDLTSIMADNKPARRLLEHGLRGLPIYRPWCELKTIMLPAAAVRPSRSVSRADPTMLGAIAECLQRNGARYQLAPHWHVDDLTSSSRTRELRAEDFHVVREGNRVVGCVACWDQRGFKQTIIHGYNGSLAFGRPWINMAFWARGRPRLPRPGTTLKMAYLSHIAVDNDDPTIAIDLIGAAQSDARQRDLELLAIGLVDEHPMCSAVSGLRGAAGYRSQLYLVHPPDTANPVETLDKRCPHVEVAVL